MPEGISEKRQGQEVEALAPVPKADCLSFGTCRNIVALSETNEFM